MTTTRQTNIIERVGGFFEIVGSAAAVARAVESGHAPRARHLAALGIDAASFERIGKR